MKLFGLRPEFFEMQEVKLCFSFCRARNKRCDIGTPGAEPQGGGSSGEATGGRVHAKVILFLRWPETVKAVRWLNFFTADTVFWGGRCTRGNKVQWRIVWRSRARGSIFWWLLM